MKNFRDIEQLSAYLDGQLSPSESARLESRISSDPELASAFNDIRAARGILRKLPARKAPRNFTLTRQMVGLKPPLPRSYSFFRFSTAFATILLMLTFAANLIAPVASYNAAASLPEQAYVVGGVGGGPESADTMLDTADATEPAIMAAPAVELQTTAIATEAEADAAREMATPAAEEMSPKEPVNESEPLEQLSVKKEAVVPVQWQIGLLILGLVSGLVMFLLRRSAMQKWK